MAENSPSRPLSTAQEPSHERCGEAPGPACLERACAAWAAERDRMWGPDENEQEGTT